MFEIILVKSENVNLRLSSNQVFASPILVKQYHLKIAYFPFQLIQKCCFKDVEHKKQ